MQYKTKLWYLFSSEQKVVWSIHDLLAWSSHDTTPYSSDISDRTVVWCRLRHRPTSIHIKQRIRLHPIHIRMHRVTCPTPIETSRKLSTRTIPLGIHSTSHNINTITRLVTRTSIPTLTQMTCARAPIYPRMEKLVSFSKWIECILFVAYIEPSAHVLTQLPNSGE